MNPYVYLGKLETNDVAEILTTNKEHYTKDEVIEIIKETNKRYKKAIYNSDFVFDIETMDKRTVTIKDTEFSVQKIFADDNKYMLLMQLEEDVVSDEELMVLQEKIQKAVSKNENILGVLLFQARSPITLMTAKLAISSKIDPNDMIISENEYVPEYITDARVSLKEWIDYKTVSNSTGYYSVKYSSTTNGSL